MLAKGSRIILSLPEVWLSKCKNPVPDNTDLQDFQNFFETPRFLPSFPAEATKPLPRKNRVWRGLQGQGRSHPPPPLSLPSCRSQEWGRRSRPARPPGQEMKERDRIPLPYVPPLSWGSYLGTWGLGEFAAGSPFEDRGHEKFVFWSQESWEGVKARCPENVNARIVHEIYLQNSRFRRLLLCPVFGVL